jgi:hypothetical protein
LVVSVPKYFLLVFSFPTFFVLQRPTQKFLFFLLVISLICIESILHPGAGAQKPSYVCCQSSGAQQCTTTTTATPTVGKTEAKNSSERSFF